MTDPEFYATLAEVFAEIRARQEPLAPEFAAAIAGRESLYEE